MNFPQKVKNTLLDIVKNMENDLSPYVKNPDKDFTRKRKLSFNDMMRFCLSMGSECTNRELLKHFRFDPKKVPSGSAYNQQLSKLLPTAFTHILKEFNNKFPMEKYREKYNIIACDGSEFNIARNPNDKTTYHEPTGKSKKGFNMLHTISLYELVSKRYLDVVIQPGRQKNEFQAFCDLVDRYSYGGVPIFVADRGFSSYNTYAHVIENGYYFAIRAKDNNTRRLLGVDSLPNEIDTTANIILSRSTAKRKRQHPELEDQYRYVCKSVSFDYINEDRCEYNMNLRVVRFKIADGKYENIVTNLPKEEFSLDEISMIYHMRWGIETSFRDLKHTIGTVNFHSKKTDYIEFEIISRIILYNFCSVIIINTPVQKKRKFIYQANFSMAMKNCVSFLQGRVKRRNIAKIIMKYISPIRPDRSYERVHRFQLPASFAYRFI